MYLNNRKYNLGPVKLKAKLRIKKIVPQSMSNFSDIADNGNILEFFLTCMSVAGGAEA
jgi:hypothetical protein